MNPDNEMDYYLDLRAKGKVVGLTISALAKLDNTNMSLHQANTLLQPLKNTLDREHFRTLHNAWPDTLPNDWSYEESNAFFGALAFAFLTDFIPIQNRVSNRI